jgi:hypothetical protein
VRRNCLLKHVIEVKIDGRTSGTERRERRGRQLLDDFKERRVYWILKEEALDRALRRTRLGRGYGPSVRQTTKWKLFLFRVSAYGFPPSLLDIIPVMYYELFRINVLKS